MDLTELIAARFNVPWAAMGPSQWSPLYEAVYQNWIRGMGVNNPDSPLQRYDYRKAWLAGMEPGADQHWASIYKTPFHPNRFVAEYPLIDTMREE